jgi:tripartite-type tricarboxylate transporter receptor subunit TctC
MRPAMTLRPSRRRALLLGAVAGVAPLSGGARAQGEDYPARPVRIIVPFPPGQAADTVVRIVADELSRRWPQRVLVENRGGAAGVPGVEAGARAAPDGYTLTNGTSGTFGVNPGVLPRLPYDPDRDFAAITNLVLGPLIVICHPSFPAQTVGELAEAARARPGAIDMATAGPATAQHMSIELLQLRTGLRFNIVHYRGSGPAVTDLVAGNVPTMCDSITSALPHIRAGRARALALTGARRIPQLPGVPTLGETLSPGYESGGWIGLAAPAATPPAIVRKVNADVVAILRDAVVATRLAEMGSFPDPGTPEQCAAFIRAEIAKWRDVARLANVRLEG